VQPGGGGNEACGGRPITLEHSQSKITIDTANVSICFVIPHQLKLPSSLDYNKLGATKFYATNVKSGLFHNA
jgi:hypothetical protein